VTTFSRKSRIATMISSSSSGVKLRLTSSFLPLCNVTSIPLFPSDGPTCLGVGHSDRAVLPRQVS
jgi:hypothetical protein